MPHLPHYLQNVLQLVQLWTSYKDQMEWLLPKIINVSKDLACSPMLEGVSKASASKGHFKVMLLQEGKKQNMDSK